MPPWSCNGGPNSTALDTHIANCSSCSRRARSNASDTANGLQKVWLTRAEAHGKSSRWIHLCRGGLPPNEVADIDELPVTTAARTAVDLARRMSFADGVTLTDAVLARRGTEPARLAAMLEREPRRRGTVRAREVFEFADGRSESPGESRSRVVMWQHRVPTPELQVPVYDDDGLIGRVDFLWREQRVIGEFDGRVKYSSQLAPGGDPAEAVWREKLREDRLRRAGWFVVRWVWADLGTPYALARRILVALGS